MILSKFISTWIIGILFGISGIYLGEGFFNYGFYTMGLFSIPYLFLNMEEKLK